MQPVTTATVHAINLIIQELRASCGPTALVVLYVQLKESVFSLNQTDPTNEQLLLLYKQLDQLDLSTLLDYYEQTQPAYEAFFIYIQESIREAVTKWVVL